MHEVLLLTAAAIACYVAFAMLALAMKRHWLEVTGAPKIAPGLSVFLRVLATALLLASLYAAIVANGPSFGSTLWVFLLSVAALGVVATLTWKPVWLRPLALLLRAPFRERA